MGWFFGGFFWGVVFFPPVYIEVVFNNDNEIIKISKSNFNLFLWLYYLLNIPWYIEGLLCECYYPEIYFVYQLEIFIRLFFKESF